MIQNRDKYLAALKAQLEPHVYHHSLALEACMGGIYDYLASTGQLKNNEAPKDDWMLAGLVHDIDFCGEYKDDHPAKTKEVLAKYGLEISDSVDRIVKAHDSRKAIITPNTQAEWAIFCADSLTGLITAVALVLPSKKLADVKATSVVKRFLKDPKFAAGTRRNEVAMCVRPETLNIPIETFINICLQAMQAIAEELNL